MTTRERIFTLFDGGIEPHIIAATLGLDVTDVAETLAVPGHEPASPSGGGGGGATLVSTRFDTNAYQGIEFAEGRVVWGDFASKLHADDGSGRIELANLPHSANCISASATHLYFTYASGAPHFVGRCNLLGEEVEGEWQEFPDSGLYGLAVYENKLYVCYEGGEKIVVCGLDGTNIQDVVAIDGEPDSVTRDGEKIYWGNETNLCIGRCNPDGSEPEQEWAKTAGEPDGVRWHEGYVYWADTVWGGIGRAAVDGSSFEPEWVSTGNNPRGVLPRPEGVYYASGDLWLLSPVRAAASSYLG